jgi:6-phosphofructokinase 1
VQDEQVLDAVARSIKEREYCVIALSEGAIPDTGTYEVDAFGHRMKGGAAEYLSDLIGDQLGLKVRIDKPNYLQRSFSASISDVDAQEAYMAGQSAVQLAVAGQSNVMVTLERDEGDAYRCHTGAAPLSEVANAEKLLPDAYLAASSDDVTAAFLAYARPLIGKPLPPLGRLTGFAIESSDGLL